MARRLNRFLAPLCALLCLAPLGAAEGVVVLPPFEVKEIHPWVIAETPDLTVLSLAPEPLTRTFANRVQDARWLTPLLLPSGVNLAATAPSSLFLRHYASDSITRRLSTGLGLDYAAFAFAIYWQDTSISFPSEDAARAWGAGRQYLDLDFLRVTGLVPGAVPVWYRDGMAELLRAATMTPEGVVFPSQGWRPSGNRFNDNPILGALGSRESPWLTLREMFDLHPDSGALSFRWKSGAERERYIRGASLFVHWGFFADDGSHRAAFLKFVARAAERAPDETMLEEILGFNFKQLQVRLNERGSGVGREKIPAPVNRTPGSPVLVREATRGDVARIVGEAYLRLAGNVAPDAAKVYLANAREVLEGAMEAGEGDPVICFLMGDMARKERNDEQALTWLERAVAGRVQRPAAYVALAELRLQRFAAQNPLSPLPVTETTAVWALLKQADAMRPRLVGTYGLALAMWRNSKIGRAHV